MKYDLSQKIDGNMTYLYKCINVTRMLLPFCQKSKSSEKNKNTLKGDISSITKKVIFILENTTFLLKYHNH